MTADHPRSILDLSGRAFLGTGPIENVVERVRNLPDTSALLHEASREGMLGILGTQLDGKFRDTGVEDPAGPFGHALRGIFVYNGAHLAELARIAQALGDESFRVLVLKGAALIRTVYRRQIGLRPLSDVDLLVEAKDLPRLLGIVRELGFVAATLSPRILTKGPVVLDLHTDLVGSARIGGRTRAFRLDDRPIWQEARLLEEGTGCLLVLSDTHQFLHLAVHALKHSYSRLVWLVDLGLVLQRVDRRELLEEAEASGTTRAAAYALVALEQVLGVDIENVRERLPRLGALERIFVSGVAARNERLGLGEIVSASSIATLRGKLAYLAELLVPDRSVLAEVFPGTPAWLLLPRRIVQMLARALTKAWRRGGETASSV